MPIHASSSPLAAWHALPPPRFAGRTLYISDPQDASRRLTIDENGVNQKEGPPSYAPVSVIRGKEPLSRLINRLSLDRLGNPRNYYAFFGIDSKANPDAPVKTTLMLDDERIETRNVYRFLESLLDRAGQAEKEVSRQNRDFIALMRQRIAMGTDFQADKAVEAVLPLEAYREWKTWGPLLSNWYWRLNRAQTARALREVAALADAPVEVPENPRSLSIDGVEQSGPLDRVMRQIADRPGVCLYPGTFNPVHNGHLKLAQHAREVYGLQAVYLMPVPNPAPKWRDPGLLSYRIRTEMALIAKADLPWLHVLTLNPMGSQPSAVHRKTLREILAHAPQFPDVNALALLAASGFPIRILTGDDTTWANRLWLRDNAERIEFIQYPMGIKPVPNDPSGIFRIKTLSRPPEGLKDDVSASLIRERVHQGASLHGLVPPPLEQYIADRGFWQ